MDFESRVTWTALRERLYRLPTLARLQDLREAAPSAAQGRKAFVAETAEGFRSSSVTGRAPRGRLAVCLEMRCHALAGCPEVTGAKSNRPPGQGQNERRGGVESRMTFPDRK
jgi:hypothetical protein